MTTEIAAQPAAALAIGATPGEPWPGETNLSGVAFLRSLTAMILDAGWGCTATTAKLFRLAQDPDLDGDRQSTVRSALWLTLVSHPRAVLEFAATESTGRARATLKQAVTENHPMSGLSLQFLEKIASPAQPSKIQAIAAEILAPGTASGRYFQVLAASAA